MAQFISKSKKNEKTVRLIIGDGKLLLIAYDVELVSDFFSPIKKLQPADYCPKPLASKIHVTYRSTKDLTADVLDDVVLKQLFVKDLKAQDAVNLTTLVTQYNTDLEN